VWAGRWCRIVLALAAAALVCSATVLGLSDRRVGAQRGALPGLTGFTLVLLLTQLALLLAFGGTVALLAWRARAPAAGSPSTVPTDRDSRPYLRGGLSAVVTMLAFAQGGLLAAVVNVGVARLLSMPVPSGFRYQARPPSLAVPWPIYAFGAAPVGMFGGILLALVVLYRKYRADCRQFEPPAGAGPSQVAAAYLKQSAPGTGGDDDFVKNRRKIAGDWAIGQLASDTGVVALLIGGGATIAMLAAEIWAFVSTGGTASSPGLGGDVWLHGAVSLIALISTFAVAVLVYLLRSAYSNKSDRRIIGAVWDVATFWPRAVQPLAPPSYGERAVPEVVDRLRLLTGRGHRGTGDSAQLLSDAGLPDLARTRGLEVPCGPVLLTGYSQGSIIAAAAIAQLPDAVCHDLALLTLACPARRVYGRAFPEYFGNDQLDTLNTMLGGDGRPVDADAPGGEEASGSDASGSEDAPRDEDAPGGEDVLGGEAVAAGAGVPVPHAGRWRNLVRRSDYIGSWVFHDPAPRLNVRDLLDNVDQPCWDPVILVPDANPTPPPVHRHDGWWQDPRTTELGIYLVGRLVADHADETPGTAQRQD
jgi:uncharacterized membrane protein